MNRRTPLVALSTAFLFEACSSDVVAPLKVPTAANLAVSAASAGDYMVLMNGNSITKSFADVVSRLGGSVTYTHAGAGLALVSGLTSTGAGQLSQVAGVSDVIADSQVQLESPLKSVEAEAAALGEPSESSQGNPAGAAVFSWQWNMRAIHAPTAWAAGHTGSSGVTVAILDTGIDYDNLDLNGLVDLSRSTSFVSSDNTLRTAYFPTRNNISDFEGHGTNVATQVSSKALVFAGVSSRTTLIGVKVLGRTGGGSTSGVLQGILWAADHGANIANMSLGSAFPKNSCRPDDVTTGPKGCGFVIGRFINRIFNYAHQKHMLIVVAAGNADAAHDGQPVDIQHNGNEYVAYCDAPHVICVAAIGPQTFNPTPPAGTPQFNADVPAPYSFFGQSVISVAAPGGSFDPVNFVTSPWPWGVDIASWVWSLCTKTRVVGLRADGTPITTACATSLRATGEIGTSQAAPHVAGLAALLMADPSIGTADPDLVKQLIETTGAPIDARYGRSRIDVASAFGL